MSQQLLGYIRDLNVRVDALTQAFEALAARISDIERRLDGNEAAADGYIVPPRRGPGRPPKQAAPDGNGA